MVAQHLLTHRSIPMAMASLTIKTYAPTIPPPAPPMVVPYPPSRRLRLHPIGAARRGYRSGFQPRCPLTKHETHFLAERKTGFCIIASGKSRQYHP
jgi:hypothetical protein